MEFSDCKDDNFTIKFVIENSENFASNYCISLRKIFGNINASLFSRLKDFYQF